MKYTYEHEIDVPFDEKKFILPQSRIKLFNNMIDNFKVYYPGLKLLYAYLNFNSETPVDYLLIFSYDVDGESKAIYWQIPYLYSNKTLPAYRYICKNGLYETFFTFCMESMCKMPYEKFKEFIPSNLCNLSFDKTDSKFWKNPDNADILTKAMANLSLQYTPMPGHKGVKISAYSKDQMLGKR